MRKDSGNLELQCDLLALGAKLEAARGGDAEQRLERQAARLQSLARSLCDDAAATRVSSPLIGQRLRQFAELQRKIDQLAGDIGALSRQECAALQCEDVESGVVVYSKRHAEELRAQLARIDELRRSLQADMAGDVDRLAAMAAVIESRAEELRQGAESTQGQIPLDRGDGEMF